MSSRKNFINIKAKENQWDIIKQMFDDCYYKDSLYIYMESQVEKEGEV